MTRLHSALFAAMIGALLFAGSALAQAPEDEWGKLPTTAPAPDAGVAPELTAPPPPPPPREPLPVPPQYQQPYAPSPTYGAAPPPLVGSKPRPREEPNTVSMVGAPSLGQWKRGQLFLLGFPLLQIRAAFGLADSFDLGVGFDSFYGVMNEPRLVARYCLFKGEAWSLAATFEGGYAFFTQRASRETRGARWITGRRNVNLTPGLVVSYQGAHPRAARLFFEGRYLLALDTEPFSTNPLSGVPPTLIAGHNGVFRAGAELPLSAKTSFVFTLGLDFHGRIEDAVAMPSVAVGLVTAI